MANVKTTDMTWPYALGAIIPGATFATASVPLTQNVTPVDVHGVPETRFNGIWIQASPDNNGVLYICKDANPPDKVAYSNVLGWLQPGLWYPRDKEWANNRDINTLFVGADNATDFGIAVIDQF